MRTRIVASATAATVLLIGASNPPEAQVSQQPEVNSAAFADLSNSLKRPLVADLSNSLKRLLVADLSNSLKRPLVNVA